MPVDRLEHLMIGGDGLFDGHRLNQYPVAHSAATAHIAHHQLVVLPEVHVQHLVEFHPRYVHPHDVVDGVRAAFGQEKAHLDLLWESGEPVGSNSVGAIA